MKLMEIDISTFEEPDYDKVKPEELHPQYLAYASVNIGGVFSEYVGNLSPEHPDFHHILHLCRVEYDYKVEIQRAKEGPWVWLIKDIKAAFVTFWTHIKELKNV